MPHIMIRYCEARARQLAYLAEQLNACPMEGPAGDGAQIEDMVERAYWGQAMACLRRGLDESERLAKVLH